MLKKLFTIVLVRKHLKKSWERYLSNSNSLRARSGTALVWNAAGQYTTQLLSFGSAVVLGRILTPGDFGLIGMITVVNSFLLIFSSFGLSTTIIQFKEFTEKDIRSLWGLAITIGIAASLTLVFVSPAIASFFGDKRLLHVAWGLAPAIAFTAMLQVPQAILQRDLNFKAVSKLNVTGSFISTIVTVLIAYSGGGYWALIAQVVLRNLVSLILMLCVVPVNWLPCWNLNLYRRIMGFTGNLTTFQVVNYFHRNLDQVMIGRFYGAEMLGYYSRAYLLLSTFNVALSGVISPVLHSALAARKGNTASIRQGFGEVVTCVLWVSAPCMGVAAGGSEEIIRLVWGPNWGSAAVPFFWLALAGMHQAVMGTLGSVFSAMERTKTLLVFGTITTILYLCAIGAGLPFGIAGVARGYSIMSHFIFPILMYYIWVKLLGGSIHSVLAMWSRPYLLGILGFIISKTIFRGFALIPANMTSVAYVAGATSASLWLYLIYRGLLADVYPILLKLKNKKTNQPA